MIEITSVFIIFHFPNISQYTIIWKRPQHSESTTQPACLPRPFHLAAIRTCILFAAPAGCFSRIFSYSSWMQNLACNSNCMIFTRTFWIDPLSVRSKVSRNAKTSIFFSKWESTLRMFMRPTDSPKHPTPNGASSIGARELFSSHPTTNCTFSLYYTQLSSPNCQ